MPYIYKSAKSEETYPELVDAIVQELDRTGLIGPPDAPVIIEEEVSRSPYSHVTVFWERWGTIPPEKRSQVILDAYERKWGHERVMKIASALGLTSAEAEKLAIKSE